MQKSATVKNYKNACQIQKVIVLYIWHNNPKTNTERNNDPELLLFPSELSLFGFGVSDIMVFVSQKNKGA